MAAIAGALRRPRCEKNAMNICWLAASACGLGRSEIFIQREIEAVIALGGSGIVVGVADESVARLGGKAEAGAATNMPRAACAAAYDLRSGLLALARCGLWQLRRWGALLRLARALPRAVSQPLTHIHAHFAHLPAIYGCGLAAIFGLPFSVSVHARDAWVPWPAGIAALSQARHIICCNEAVKERLLTLRPVLAGRTYLVYHGLLRRELPPDSITASEREPCLFAAGRWVPKKGFAVLIRAFALAREHVPSLRLCLAGDGPEAEAIRRIVSELGVATASAIAMPGWLSQGEMRNWLLRCAAVVVPSLAAADGDRDGIPNIVLEAMAAGAPVVASRIGGIPEAVADNVTGRLVEPGDSAALAEAICALMAQPAVARAWSAAARERLRRDFIAEENAARWMEILSR